MAVWSEAIAPSCYCHTSALAHLPATMYIGKCLESVPKGPNHLLFEGEEGLCKCGVSGEV